MEIQIGNWHIKRTTDGLVRVWHTALAPEDALVMRLDEWQRITALLGRDPVEDYALAAQQAHKPPKGNA